MFNELQMFGAGADDEGKNHNKSSLNLNKI